MCAELEKRLFNFFALSKIVWKKHFEWKTFVMIDKKLNENKPILKNIFHVTSHFYYYKRVLLKILMSTFLYTQLFVFTDSLYVTVRLTCFILLSCIYTPLAHIVACVSTTYMLKTNKYHAFHNPWYQPISFRDLAKLDFHYNFFIKHKTTMNRVLHSSPNT